MKITDTLIYKFIKEYMSSIEIVDYKHGHIIDSCIEESTSIYYILKGIVKVQNVSVSGNKILIDEISKEEFVGHISTMRGEGFHSNVICKEDSTLVKIPRNIFAELMKNSEFSSLFYEKTSKRIYFMYKKLLLERLFHWEEIVAYYILENSNEDIFIYKSMYEICEYLNISRRGLYNIINRFVYEECLEKRESVFAIKDRMYLEELASNIYDYYGK